MERRNFLKSAGMAAAAGALAGKEGIAGSGDAPPGPVPGPQPNILFILVDEMRFPSVFPEGVTDAGGFLQKFMPNVYSLWQRGVKFGQHYTAASACTPSRGVLITGLYSQQSWLMQTLTNEPGQVSATPPLNPAYPTYGKLLRRAGYQTPYVGKWHVSFEVVTGLEPYGFRGLTTPDPVGYNLQGTVGQKPGTPYYQYTFLNDEDIAQQAVQWLGRRRADDRPWCLTVSFVNPHDQEFFWAGTEFQTYNNLFPDGSALQPVKKYSTPGDPPVVAWDDNPLKSPGSYGYPALPPNWESAATLQANKPSTQVMGQLASAAIFSGIAQETPDQTGFSVRRYPIPDSSVNIGYGVAPFGYWQRCLDSYTAIMQIVDQRIGEVLQALPREVADNTIIVFASDHGEYAGAHGFMSGKILTCYDEAFHVPLIVVDPSHRFVGETETLRTGLTSSVDMLPLLVSLGNNGTQDWLSGRLDSIYGARHDMLPMLRSASAPGRPYVLLASDELIPAKFNFNDSPIHIAGIRTSSAKLATYATWTPRTGRIEPGTVELEFYDYATPEGVAELANTPGDERAQQMSRLLLDDLIPNELRARLPGALAAAQDLSKAAYLFTEAQALDTSAPTPVRDLLAGLGYGREF
ncbi:sulfatase-like hydrolase/transferase [Paracraurococcus lichenis]|uniref:Sulfatase-like hydrolase/transferase n=1 Tax=Paracraurococcus lichenis TaxID=3064888 RepID=A0ABT9E4L2_9PROT|nr:sulfatase-like hydrolase/transferase [Paracraurococcus sp. LOR1-02]MDO9711083.1 sulfatase-like hydrolase/transferase [Paracraurococcus sp. LOR1-02]